MTAPRVGITGRAQTAGLVWRRSRRRYRRIPVNPPNAIEFSDDLDERQPLDGYNFAHVRTKHIVQDVRRRLTDRGIRPSDVAPDFALPLAGGGTLRLSDLRGGPVPLNFDSYS